MSKPPIGDDVPSEMTAGHEAEAVSNGVDTGELIEVLSDGLEMLRSAYQEFWSETHQDTPAAASKSIDLPSLSGPVNPQSDQTNESLPVRWHAAQSKRPFLMMREITQKKVRKASRQVRRRFGLPENFIPRMQRFGRGVLLELNVYQLPTGEEYIPYLPTGPLGSRHLYALLTVEQYLAGKRGSVYVRADGRIFDYSVVSSNSLGDMFDTGYTIYDLERTGRYAPSEARLQLAEAVPIRKRAKKKKTRATKLRRAAKAG